MSLQISETEEWYERLCKYLDREEAEKAISSDSEISRLAFKYGFGMSMLAGILAGRDIDAVRRRILEALGEGKQ